MKTYRITFSGRKIGAIGTFSTYRDTVEAENEEAAILKLYDTYEHIRIIEVATSEGSNV